MTEYELIMEIQFYNIMSGCETGGCAEFHAAYCWQCSTCFYDELYKSAVAALEMGWY